VPNWVQVLFLQVLGHCSNRGKWLIFQSAKRLLGRVSKGNTGCVRSHTFRVRRGKLKYINFLHVSLSGELAATAGSGLDRVPVLACKLLICSDLAALRPVVTESASGHRVRRVGFRTGPGTQASWAARQLLLRTALVSKLLSLSSPLSSLPAGYRDRCPAGF